MRRDASAPAARTTGEDDKHRRLALIRLVGAVLAEQHDESTEGRRYLGLDGLARSRIILATDNTGEAEQPAKEVTTGTAEPVTA